MAEVFEYARRIFEKHDNSTKIENVVLFLKDSIEAGETIARAMREIEGLMIDGPYFANMTLNSIMHDNYRSARIAAEVWEAQVARTKWILRGIEKQNQPEGTD